MVKGPFFCLLLSVRNSLWDRRYPYHESATKEDRRKDLSPLMFITENRNEDIKSRKVADGSKQHTYNGYDKLDGSFPTV